MLLAGSAVELQVMVDRLDRAGSRRACATEELRCLEKEIFKAQFLDEELKEDLR